MLIDSFVKASWKTFCEMPYGKRVIDVEMGVSDELFEFGYVAVGVFWIHLNPFHDICAGFFFLQDVGILSSE